MKINNIKIGQVIKDYKEFCLLMNEKISAGNTKKKQLKQCARYMKWHKEGNKFIIDEIYDKPLPKQDRRRNNKGSNNNKYIEEIRDILTYYIYNQIKINNSNVVTLSISELINILGLANNTYSLGNSRKKELSDILHIEMVAIYNFYSTSRTEFKKIIKRALKNLQSRSVLIYQDTFMVADIKNNKLNKRPATDDECDLILDTQNYMLKNYKMQSFKDLFLAGGKIYKEFMENVNKELPWDFYYPAYRLICGKNAVAREYKKVLEKKEQLNNKSIDRLEKVFEIVDKNSNEQKLINNLISFEGHNIHTDDLLKVKEQENYHNYYLKLQAQDRKINEENYKRDKIKNEYKYKDIIDISDVMKYKYKIKKNHEDEEYWSFLLNLVEGLPGETIFYRD